MIATNARFRAKGAFTGELVCRVCERRRVTVGKVKMKSCDAQGMGMQLELLHDWVANNWKKVDYLKYLG